MAISFSCGGCAKKINAPDAMAGKRARCPNCKTVLEIPAGPLAAEAKPSAAPPATPGRVATAATSARTVQSRKPTPKPAPAKQVDRSDDFDFSRLSEQAAAKPAPQVEQDFPPGFDLPSPAGTNPRITPTSKPRTPARSPVGMGDSGMKSRHLHWLLMILLVPLAISLVAGDDGDVGDRLKHTLETNQELIAKLDGKPNLSFDDLLLALPGRAIEGAFLPRDTMLHWLFAILAAALFAGLILALFDLGGATLQQVLLVGLFTSTVGVISLLMFQWAAEWSQGIIVTGRGVLVILFYVVRLIGFSYRAALDPANGFVLSLLGFTVGVGLCEEIVKALPIMTRVGQMRELGWRGACVWGLASGAGFGIAEGVLYSADHYNGVTTGGVYLIRFLSCVVLHAVWAASSALVVYRNQDVFEHMQGWSDYLVSGMRVVLAPMILHGLYDTLLKRDMQLYALLIAAASFLPLAWLIEQVHKDDEELASRALRRASSGARYA